MTDYIVVGLGSCHILRVFASCFEMFILDKIRSY